MTPKQFIQHVLINEIGDIVTTHTYLSFSLIAIGIEFLGKCLLTDNKDWHTNKTESDKAFQKGLNLIVEEDYRYKNLNLKDQLRNGFAHSMAPKTKIMLSEVKHGTPHLHQLPDGRTILVAEIFYRDFVRACHKVLNRDFPENDKMNRPLLEFIAH